MTRGCEWAILPDVLAFDLWGGFRPGGSLGVDTVNNDTWKADLCLWY